MRLIFISSIVLYSLIGVGQAEINYNGSAAPDLIVKDDIPNNPSGDLEYQFYIRNNSSDSVSIKLARHEVLNADWQYYVVDCNIAYLVSEDFNDWVSPTYCTIAPGDSSNFRVDYLFNYPFAIQDGCTIHEYYIINESLDTLDSIIINLSTVGNECYLKTDENKNKINIYYDYNSNTLHIEGVEDDESEVIIYNIEGKILDRRSLYKMNNSFSLYSNSKTLFYTIVSENSIKKSGKIVLN